VWRAYPLLAIFVGFGILVGVVYIWRAMQKAFFAEGRVEAAHHEPMPPISLPERLGAVLLIGTSVLVGLYPQMLLNLIVPALNSPLFEGLRKGSWQ
jgi:NADH-quinone oxidoreductase subunit M